MTRTEWLQSLKAGDKVAISDRFGPGYIGIFTITRTTKTLLIIETKEGGEYKFNKSYGHEQGKDYGLRSICEVTPKIEDMIMRSKYLKKVLDEYSVSKLKTESLKQIYEIITNENTN